LIIAMPVLFFIGSSFASSFYRSVPAGDNLRADIAGRLALALTMLAGMVSGVSAFILGLLAILKQKEKAILVYLSTVIGALLLLLLAGEIVFPH
jgi:predicted membrane-bound spermidine synthase